MAFDPSKPFSVEEAAPSGFDPTQPFTVGEPKASLKPGTPVLSAPAPANMGMLLRSPGLYFSTLAQRENESASNAWKNQTLLGVSSKALAAGLGGQDKIPLDRRPAVSPARSASEVVADLVGGLRGSIFTPESAVGLPARAALAIGRPIASALARTGLSQGAQRVGTAAVTRGVEGAVVNAASDVPIQAANIALGDQEKYDPMGTVLNAAFGAGLGTVGGAGGKQLEVNADRKAAHAAGVDSYIAKRGMEQDADARAVSDPYAYRPAGTAFNPEAPFEVVQNGEGGDQPDIAAMLPPEAMVGRVREFAANDRFDLEAKEVPDDYYGGVGYDIKVAPKAPDGAVRFSRRGEPVTETSPWYDPSMAYPPEPAYEGGPLRSRLREDSGWAPRAEGDLGPGVIYRGISAEEMDSIRKTGSIKSDGAFNIGDAQNGLTYWTTELPSAQSYAHDFAPSQHKATGNKPAFIIAVKDPGTDVRVDGVGSHEIGIPHEIKASEIIGTWEGRPYEGVPGDVEVRGGREGSSTGPHTDVAWRRVHDDVSDVMNSPAGADIRAGAEAPDTLGVGAGEVPPFDPGKPFTAEGPDVMASTKGGLRGQTKPGAIPAVDPKDLPGVDRNVKKLATDLRKIMNLTALRQGRIGLRGALGTFNRKSGVVRSKVMHELDVLSHEAGHHLEFVVPHKNLLSAMAAHEAELKALDYEPAKQRRYEGFAEFLRWYMTNPAEAKKMAPNFYSAFEGAMTLDDPKMLAGMQKVRDGYQQWLTVPSATRAKARTVFMTRKSWLEKKAERFREDPGGAIRSVYGGLIDGKDSVSRSVEKLIEIAERNGRPITLKAAEDPGKILHRTPNAFNQGMMDLMRGPRAYGSNVTMTHGLADALKLALGDDWSLDRQQSFGAYLAGRRILGEYERYAKGELPQPPDAMTKEDWAQAVADLEASEPTWRQAAQMVYDYTNAMWEKRWDAGLITEKTYFQGLEHKDYVPLHRDFSDEVSAGLQRTGTLKSAGGAKQFRGSTRDIINPIQSLMREAFILNMVIARNDVLRNMAKLADRAGAGSGKWAERVPASEIKGISIDAYEAIARAAADMGMNERDVQQLLYDLAAKMGSDEAPTTIFRSGDIWEGKDPIVYFWEDGKRHALQLADGDMGREMYEALTDMTPLQSNLFMDIALIANRAARVGIVTEPAFLIRNPFVDALTTWLTTNVGYIPFVDQIIGLKHVLTGSDLYERYVRAGGGTGGPMVAAEREARLEQGIEALRKDGMQIRRLSHEPWKLFAELAEISETMNRVGLFRRALKDKKRMKGLTPWEQDQEAVDIANDVMDWNKTGSHPTAVFAGRASLFLRAALLGLDKYMRTLLPITDLGKTIAPLFGKSFGPANKDALDMAQKAWVAMAALATLKAGVTAFYEGNDEYENINDDLRATHVIFYLPFGGDGDAPEAFDGKGFGTSQGTKGTWFFVPMAHEWGLLPSMAERAVEAQRGDEAAWDRFGADIGTLLIPPTDIPLIKPGMEVSANRTSMGQPIIPDHLANAPKEEQITPNTSPFGKVVAKGWNETVGEIERDWKVSPAVVDHFFTGWLTSWGRNFLSATSAMSGERAPRAMGLEDAPVTRRFFKDPARGSRAAEAFWDRVSMKEGNYEEAEKGFNLKKERDLGEAVKFLSKLPADERAYVLMATSPDISSEERLLHPMIMARKVIGVMSELRQALTKGDVRDENDEFQALTPTQRRDADRALLNRIMAIQTNALIESGVRGWRHRDLMPEDAALPEPVRQALEVWLSTEGLEPDSTAYAREEWRAMRPTLEKDLLDPEAYVDAMESGKAGERRFIREVQPAR